MNYTHHFRMSMEKFEEPLAMTDSRTKENAVYIPELRLWVSVKSTEVKTRLRLCLAILPYFNDSFFILNKSTGAYRYKVH